MKKILSLSLFLMAGMPSCSFSSSLYKPSRGEMVLAGTTLGLGFILYKTVMLGQEQYNQLQKTTKERDEFEGQRNQFACLTAGLVLGHTTDIRDPEGYQKAQISQLIENVSCQIEGKASANWISTETIESIKNGFNAVGSLGIGVGSQFEDLQKLISLGVGFRVSRDR